MGDDCEMALGSGRGQTRIAWWLCTVVPCSPELNYLCVELEMVPGWVDHRLIMFFKKKKIYIWD